MHVLNLLFTSDNLDRIGDLVGLVDKCKSIVTMLQFKHGLLEAAFSTDK